MAATPTTLKDKVEQLAESVDKNENATSLSVGERGGAAVVSYFEHDPTAQGYSMAQLKSASSRGRSLRKIDELRQRGYQSQVRSFSEQLRGLRNTVEHPQSKQAAEFTERFLASKKSLRDVLSDGLEGDDLDAIMKSITVNTYDADAGGALVLPEFAQEIQGDRHTNDLWPRVRRFPVSGNTMSIPKKHRTDRRDGARSGGIKATWDGEESSVTKSRPAVGEVSLKLNKLRAYVLVTDEMLADSSFPIGSFVGECVYEELEFKKGNATVRGTGVKQPLGWLNASGTVVVTKESGQPADKIWGANIEEMYRRADMRYINDYFWLANQNTIRELAEMELGGTSAIGDGRALTYLPPNGQADAPYGTIKGRPLVLSEFASTLGDKGDLSFVNYNDYWAIEKGGISEETSTHVEFERDLTAYKFTERLDGRPCEDEPIVPANGSATADTLSGFITLAERA